MHFGNDNPPSRPSNMDSVFGVFSTLEMHHFGTLVLVPFWDIIVLRSGDLRMPGTPKSVISRVPTIIRLLLYITRARGIGSFDTFVV